MSVGQVSGWHSRDRDGRPEMSRRLHWRDWTVTEFGVGRIALASQRNRKWLESPTSSTATLAGQPTLTCEMTTSNVRRNDIQMANWHSAKWGSAKWHSTNRQDTNKTKSWLKEDYSTNLNGGVTVVRWGSMGWGPMGSVLVFRRTKDLGALRLGFERRPPLHNPRRYSTFE